MVRIHFLTQVCKMWKKSADLDHCKLIFEWSTLAITQPQPWFLVGRCVLPKKCQLPKSDQNWSADSTAAALKVKNLKMCTVTKPIIRFTPNFVNGGHLSPSIRGSSFIPFYLAVSEILPCLQIYDTPFTTTTKPGIFRKDNKCANISQSLFFQHGEMLRVSPPLL